MICIKTPVSPPTPQYFFQAICTHRLNTDCQKARGGIDPIFTVSLISVDWTINEWNSCSLFRSGRQADTCTGQSQKVVSMLTHLTACQILPRASKCSPVEAIPHWLPGTCLQPPATMGGGSRTSIPWSWTPLNWSLPTWGGPHAGGWVSLFPGHSITVLCWWHMTFLAIVSL